MFVRIFLATLWVFGCKLLVAISIRLSNYIYTNVEAKGENQYHSIVGIETAEHPWDQGEEDSQRLKKGQTQT